MPVIGAGIDATAEVSALIDERAVSSVFQPVARLDTREIVGYEALSRGPEGTRWEPPAALFGAAAAIGRTGELDWVCRAKAYQAALRADLPPTMPLFVNTDPSATPIDCPIDLLSTVAQAHDRLRVVTDLTERAFTADPVALVAAAEAGRRSGCGIAIDDVGLDPAALALLPFAAPDILKLDGQLLRQAAHPMAARAVTAVAAYAERTGATVLAEGIETEEQLELARRMGASVGQGWLFGRPASLPIAPDPPLEPLRMLSDDPAISDQPGGLAARADATPYDVVAVERQVAMTDKATLVAIGQYLEERAFDDAAPPVVLGCCQDAAGFASFDADHYPTLANRAAFIAMFGVGLPERPARGVLGVPVDPHSLLREEWNLIVLGPHFAAAVVAREIGHPSPSGQHRFVHAVTYDWNLVTAAARTLFRHFRTREPATGGR